eukprot:750825-Amphidinium_carterae.2
MATAMLAEAAAETPSKASAAQQNKILQPESSSQPHTSSQVSSMPLLSPMAHGCAVRVRMKLLRPKRWHVQT